MVSSGNLPRTTVWGDGQSGNRVRFSFPYIPPVVTNPTTAESSFFFRELFVCTAGQYSVCKWLFKAKIENPPVSAVSSIASASYFLFLMRWHESMLCWRHGGKRAQIEMNWKNEEVGGAGALAEGNCGACLGGGEKRSATCSRGLFSPHLLPSVSLKCRINPSCFQLWAESSLEHLFLSKSVPCSLYKDNDKNRCC